MGILSSNSPGFVALEEIKNKPKTPFCLNFSYAGGSDETLIAAPGAGKSIYIESIQMDVTCDGTFGWYDDSSVLLGVFYLKAAGGNSSIQKRFDHSAVQVTANKALKVNCSEACHGIVTGFIM